MNSNMLCNCSTVLILISILLLYFTCTRWETNSKVWEGFNCFTSKCTCLTIFRLVKRKCNVIYSSRTPWMGNFISSSWLCSSFSSFSDTFISLLYYYFNIILHWKFTTCFLIVIFYKGPYGNRWFVNDKIYSSSVYFKK